MPTYKNRRSTEAEDVGLYVTTLGLVTVSASWVGMLTAGSFGFPVGFWQFVGALVFAQLVFTLVVLLVKS